MLQAATRAGKCAPWQLNVNSIDINRLKSKAFPRLSCNLKIPEMFSVDWEQDNKQKEFRPKKKRDEKENLEMNNSLVNESVPITFSKRAYLTDSVGYQQVLQHCMKPKISNL